MYVLVIGTRNMLTPVFFVSALYFRPPSKKQEEYIEVQDYHNVRMWRSFWVLWSEWMRVSMAQDVNKPVMCKVLIGVGWFLCLPCVAVRRCGRSLQRHSCPDVTLVLLAWVLSVILVTFYSSWRVTTVLFRFSFFFSFFLFWLFWRCMFWVLC